MELLVTPWADVVRIERIDGAAPAAVQLGETTTPARISLLPGRYRATLGNGALGVRDEAFEFDVHGPGVETVRHALATFDAAEAAAAMLAP